MGGGLEGEGPKWKIGRLVEGIGWRWGLGRELGEGKKEQVVGNLLAL